MEGVLPSMLEVPGSIPAPPRSILTEQWSSEQCAVHMAGTADIWHADGILRKATASERGRGAQLGGAVVGMRQPALAWVCSESWTEAPNCHG